MSEVMGNLTKTQVSADGTTWADFCNFTGELNIDFGSFQVNKEYCLSSNDPVVALGDRDFSQQTFSFLWTEGDSDAANKIFRDAHLSDSLDAKKVYIAGELNNKPDGGTSGTRYEAQFVVVGYRHEIKRGSVNKTTVTVEQLTVPTETAAA